MPLSNCLTSRNAPEVAAAHLPPEDLYGRLLLALLHILERQPAHALCRYCATVFKPEEAQSQMMSLWAGEGDKEEGSSGGSLAATRAAGSVAWERARRQRALMISEWRALTDAGICAAPSRLYLWAKCLLLTRALHVPGVGPTLCPLIDLANHLSLGATARWQLVEDVRGGGEPHVQLLANYTLDVGEEVTLCYDPDADYVDLFERYGFFDTSAVVHTAEVAVPTGALARCAAGGEDLEAWRAELVAAQAERGRDDELGAWWVPDTAIDSCPLFAAVRATLVSKEELGTEMSKKHADEVLRRPIVREDEARAKLAALLQSHLNRYTCTPECAARDLQSGLLTTAEEAATRLLYFESTLLQAQLKVLQS